MQAGNTLLETDQYGHLVKQPRLPLTARMEGIFEVLDDIGRGRATRRKPPAKIVGQGKIISDIMAPVVSPEDWDALQ